MEWNCAADGAMLGESAACVLDAARMSWMLDYWKPGEVLGLDAGAGRVALLRVTVAGRVQVVALAPSADWRGGEVRPAAQVFAQAWPASWITKRRTGEVRPVPVDALGFECGYACGIGPRKAVILCQVVAWRGDVLDSVRLVPGGEVVEVASLDVSRWWPFHKWPDGAAALFERQAGRATHNYRLACIQAANLDRKAKGKPAISGQAGKKLKAAKKAIDAAD